MPTITIGGLATGLDTDSIVSQLVALERQRGVGVLETQRTDANTRRIALQTFNSKVTAFLTAVNTLKAADDVVARRASSSDEGMLTATAGSGANDGTTEITVDHVARAAIATSANGKTAATSTVATGSGTFAFRVGPSGPVQTVAVDATTTLTDLASAINELDAGATASIVNLGTTTSPDYRLRLASDATGTESAVSIVTDDTTLGIAVSQSALDAQFTVSGFSDPLTRASNRFDDVIPGVSIELLAAGGPVSVTVGGDDDATVQQVDAVVQAFNDIVTFVAGESLIEQDTSSAERSVTIGPLALDGTVRGIMDSLRSIISGPTDTGDADGYTVLAQIGITTARDGTLTFDQATFRTELQSRASDVGKLFGGAAGGTGVADRLSDYLTAVTQSGGLIDVRNASVADEIRSLEDRIAAGQRNLDAYEENLRAQFTSLELLVQSLKSQGSFLASALGSIA